MSRKFVGKLIRIMMTKSSSCDILKKKRTIRRGSGSRPKGSYLMDLRFWNYVIPDGSTTGLTHGHCWAWFWNYVIPDGSTTAQKRPQERLRFGTMSFQMVLLHTRQWRITRFGFGTMSFQMVLLHALPPKDTDVRFGTMSFQMVLLRAESGDARWLRFGTMSFQMVLLQIVDSGANVLRFGTMSFQMVLLPSSPFPALPVVLELCHSRWFYYH